MRPLSFSSYGRPMLRQVVAPRAVASTPERVFGHEEPAIAKDATHAGCVGRVDVRGSHRDGA